MIILNVGFVRCAHVVLLKKLVKFTLLNKVGFFFKKDKKNTFDRV
jgi:hypothetical protein